MVGMAECMGSVSLTARDLDGVENDVTLSDVLYIPGLGVNLFSVACTAVYSNATIIYQGRIMQLKPQGIESNTIAIGKYSPNEQLFVLDAKVNISDIGRMQIKSKLPTISDVKKHNH